MIEALRFPVHAETSKSGQTRPAKPDGFSGVCLSNRLRSRAEGRAEMAFGEVAEWSNASVSKTDIAERLSRVRIPPSPLFLSSPFDGWVEAAAPRFATRH